jgi:hypothetical protein
MLGITACAARHEFFQKGRSCIIYSDYRQQTDGSNPLFARVPA